MQKNQRINVTAIKIFLIYFIAGFICVTLFVMVFVPPKPGFFDRKTIEQAQKPLSPLGWWNNDWSHFKSCYISNPLEDYCIMINISKIDGGGDVDCEGDGCEDDFDDIRFVRTDNSTLLDYWIQNITSADQATFWVNNSYNDSEILLYYGNSGVGNISNGTNTFEFFDNFTGASINSNKWTTEVSGYEVTGDGLLYSHWDGANRGRIQGTTEFTYNQEIRVSQYGSDTTPGDHHTPTMFADSGNSDDRVDMYFKSDANVVSCVTSKDNIDTVSNNIAIGWDVTDEHMYIIHWTNTYADYFANGSIVYHTTNVPDDIALEPIFIEEDDGNGDMWVNWVFVRNYTDGTQPSWNTFGAEQS